MTYSQVPGVRKWTSLEGKRALFCLLQMATNAMKKTKRVLYKMWHRVGQASFKSCHQQRPPWGNGIWTRRDSHVTTWGQSISGIYLNIPKKVQRASYIWDCSLAVSWEEWDSGWERITDFTHSSVSPLFQCFMCAFFLITNVCKDLETKTKNTSVLDPVEVKTV